MHVAPKNSEKSSDKTLVPSVRIVGITILPLTVLIDPIRCRHGYGRALVLLKNLDALGNQVRRPLIVSSRPHEVLSLRSFCNTTKIRRRTNVLVQALVDDTLILLRGTLTNLARSVCRRIIGYQDL